MDNNFSQRLVAIFSPLVCLFSFSLPCTAQCIFIVLLIKDIIVRHRHTFLSGSSPCIFTPNSVLLYVELASLGHVVDYIICLPSKSHRKSFSNSSPKLVHMPLLKMLSNPTVFYKASCWPNGHIRSLITLTTTCRILKTYTTAFAQIFSRQVIYNTVSDPRQNTILFGR